MRQEMKRREFVQLTLAGSALCLGGPGVLAFAASPNGSRLVSPGCRKTKVRVARVYMGDPQLRAWPKPDLNLQEEVRFYESEFAKLHRELTDVEFVVDELVTAADQIGPLKTRLKDVDGILAIHLRMGINAILDEILSVGQPTMVFAVPYSGHEWSRFGSLQKEDLGAKMECMLTSDYRQLAAAVRPFRAIHHVREAKILNVTSRASAGYDAIQEKLGTQIEHIELKRVLDTCQAVDDDQARAEAEKWIQGAVAVVEPSREAVIKSCKLALAFERLLDEEEATVITVDCYGTMYRPLCQGYAFPCVGFTRLNDMGLGGICESDIASAMTYILFQGLTGRPGFISDPTVDESRNSIILAHCLGTRKMDGPDGPAAPYKLRTIMERQEGVVPQVKMRVGQKVTQAKLVGTDLLPYFVGEIVEVPELDRGCRTKITVQVDGSVEKLWKNWSHGLHRVTCYGDIAKELEHFCRFKAIEMRNEAA
jgi:hypothetical protein